MTAARLPFTVIGGFLGAGKTTLLNYWLRHATGRRLAVLVNDFGALNIDAELIDSTSGDTIALTNGCVCCQIGDELSLALMRVLDSGAPFDAVVVEASGVADPWRIAQLGRADPRLQLDAVIVLVDAAEALEQARDPLLADTLERQLKAADLVVINKTDLVAPGRLAALRSWIAAGSKATHAIETAHAAVPLALLNGAMLLDDAAGAEHSLACHGGHSPAHGVQFDTWSCRPSHTFPSATLREWLQTPPPGLLRLKGVLRTLSADGQSGWSELQFAGRQGSLRPAHPPHAGAALVAIALRGRLPRALLASTFGETAISAIVKEAP
jgi:G3E family GTPase